MRMGTKSLLFGAHQVLIHPWFVLAAWTKLYSFPWDFRIWLACIVHDWGYWGCRKMDDDEGEWHIALGASIMGWLFDFEPLKGGPRWLARCVNFINARHEKRNWKVRTEDHPYYVSWYCFCFYHSRFIAKKYGLKTSRLCIADKLAITLEPWWFYLPRVILTGEINEYMKLVGDGKYKNMQALSGGDLSLWQQRRVWHRRMTDYVRRWVYAHRDGREDTWTAR